MAQGGPSERATSSGLASETTVHARLAVRPVRPCPVTRLAGAFGLRGLVAPGDAQRAPQAVVDTPDDADLRRAGAHPVVRVGAATVCRLPTLARGPDAADVSACGHGHCLAHGFGFLPLSPYNTRWAGDTLRCSFAAIGTDEVERVVRAFGEADFVVELEQLVQGGDESGEAPGAARTVSNLDQLTDRQREVASAAVEAGYFDRDGPSAAEMAERLDISKATLSEHLGTVQAELLEQAFGDG
jgi:DNA-binding CsgD family transcriptional regulator/uncharacterized protein YjeT (DUF2065 family)